MMQQNYVCTPQLLVAWGLDFYSQIGNKMRDPTRSICKRHVERLTEPCSPVIPSFKVCEIWLWVPSLSWQVQVHALRHSQLLLSKGKKNNSIRPQVLISLPGAISNHNPTSWNEYEYIFRNCWALKDPIRQFVCKSYKTIKTYIYIYSIILFHITSYYIRLHHITSY